MGFLSRAVVSAALTVIGLLPGVTLAPPAAAAASTGPHLSIAGVTLKEDDRQAIFKVTVTGTHGDVTVNYASRDGSAVAGKDYSPTKGPLTIKADDTEGLIVVKVFADTTFETDEDFFIDLSNTITATIDVGTAQAIIQNDDPAPGIAIGDARGPEGDGSGLATRVVVPVALSAAAGLPVTVQYMTTGYCAAGGPIVGFQGKCAEPRGTVEFPADDGSMQFITLPIL
jgi:hypothetical protein